MPLVFFSCLRYTDNMNEKKTTNSKAPRSGGVFPAARRDGSCWYRASLTCRRKHISLGSYRDRQGAENAYREGRRILDTPDISLLDYGENATLPFEKWVCLVNYRDNGIYFGKPIYMGQKMFFYYLSPSIVLKFDIDDLFYYSSHKIMRRGNRYFVADYGMQVGIASRYGIKNYAVRGRDYEFRNGDTTDFRRENLVIRNRYHGVRLEGTGADARYAVRIHVRGDLLVGRYSTELEAAIAYNKAIDTLLKNGIARRYTPNYIEGLSPSRYADLYTRLEISPRVKGCRPQ